MKAPYWVGGSLALLSCQTEANPGSQVVGNAEAPLTAKQEIFARNKQFVYQVSHFEGSRSVVDDTVTLFSRGIAWESDSTQKAIDWLGKSGGAKNGTGVKENADGVWIHPPRFEHYAILELSPFPEIRQPYKPGQEWDWELAVGSHYSNPDWAVWEGEMVVKAHYKAVGDQISATPLGQLKCKKVTAISRCRAGTASLTLLFHPQYGFVELDYVNIDARRMRFQLLSVGIQNEFNGGAYFGRQ
ncbi:hypothetical protein [Hymenobacter tenuis]